MYLNRKHYLVNRIADFNQYVRNKWWRFVCLKVNLKGWSEDDTVAKFFRLFNWPYRLHERVGRNTLITVDEVRNKEIDKYHGLSLKKYYQDELTNSYLYKALWEE